MLQLKKLPVDGSVTQADILDVFIALLFNFNPILKVYQLYNYCI